MNAPDGDPSDPLRALFEGRRPWRRVPCAHAVVLSGSAGKPYAGAARDLSRAGVLVAVTDPAFRDGEERDGITLIQERFPDGVEIAFPEAGITR